LLDTPAPRLASEPLQPDSRLPPAEILLASLPHVTGRGGVENRQYAPASLAVLGRYESCTHLYNTPARLVARNLPVGDTCLKRFEHQQCWAYPEHTRAKRLRRARVIEQWSALFVTDLDVKIIAHHQDDINIIRVGFRSNIAPKEDETFQCACGTGQIIDTPQACCDRLSLRCPTPELRQHLVQRGLMHTCRSFSCMIELRQRHALGFLCPALAAERWRSPAAGSRSEGRVEAVGSQVQCCVRPVTTHRQAASHDPRISVPPSLLHHRSRGLPPSEPLEALP